MRHTETLADFIKVELGKRGWSLRTLAMYAEVSPNTVSRIMRGVALPDPETIRKIAKVLEVDGQHLMRMSGHLDSGPHQLKDPQVIFYASRLDSLPLEWRQRALDIVAATVDNFWEAIGETESALPSEQSAEEQADKGQVLLSVIQLLGGEMSREDKEKALDKLINLLRREAPGTHRKYEENLRREQGREPEPRPKPKKSHSAVPQGRSG